jgi:hypothetical protein
MKGDASMTQAIEWTLLIGLVGLIWVIVLDFLGDNHRTHDKRQGSPSPEHDGGEEPQAHSPQQSKVAA